ncbi:hypothetical protein GS597_08605 [Synechococcales cyanobacterium C]|uniref:Prepilin-type N-terminal cleavage/methylation domain-containing protein n=1 Tax=Petrachloros mirabilis ULC683 TaxID=2781853 RepID=A0A8K1ZZ04_9CYAN|nr:hypothetical protein [Petrachloros mirabilis]NCJ06563.1 hypothetical protein [Petrachloros mirabilis ULC683]
MNGLSRLNRSFALGFTFVELMVALSMTGVVVTLAFTALQYTLQRDKAGTQLESRQAELSRALDFIADDLREATQVSGLKTPPELVMRIHRADGSWVDYFLVDQVDQRWRGPTIIYRRTSDQTSSQALVDAIAAEDVTCPGEGDLLERRGKSSSSHRAGGFRVRVQAPSRIKVCLWGHLPETNERVLATTQVFTRGDASPQP